MIARVVLAAVVLALASVAHARDDDTVGVVRFDPGSCKPKARSSLARDPNAIPVTITDFEVKGELVDPPATVRRQLAPTMQRHRAMTDDLRDEAIAAAAAIGYHVVGLGTKETPTGAHAQLHIAPLPTVRRIYVEIKQPIRDVLGTPLFKDEVQRRLRLRPGSYLPWAPDERRCELYEEKRRVEAFLHDEGYFDAEAVVEVKLDGPRATLSVRVALGAGYTTAVDKIFVPDAERLPINVDEIRKIFRHPRCIAVIAEKELGCYFGYKRFTRAQHAADVQAVIKKFHSLQYPAVRVRSSEPVVDRSTKTVEFSITIEPRRKVDVKFEGVDFNLVEDLRKQLTFDQAQSADDLEAANSAKAIASYLQTRGLFDARVTWEREQFNDIGIDKLIFRITPGRRRVVREVTFHGNLALEPRRVDAEQRLRDAIVTKEVGTTARLLGARTSATSAGLLGDMARIKALYRRSGYRDAQVSVSASTEPIALGSAALTAALLATDRGNDLYVRFDIAAGPPTLLTQVHVELGPEGDELATADDRALCAQVLKDLAEFYGHPGLATPVNSLRCIGMGTNLPYRENDVADTRDRVRDRLFLRGRPRTDVDLETRELGPHRNAVIYRVRNTQPLAIGKIVIRGNFRTSDRVILDELEQAGFIEGRPLTATALAESTRRIRNTALFDSVNVRLLDLETATAGALNTVVEVTERYDYKYGGLALSAEAGGSSFNGLFVKLVPSFKNLFGHGPTLDTAVTVGLDIPDLLGGTLTRKQFAVEGTLRIPPWLTRRAHIPFDPQVEITGFRREQDTPRFGLLTTTGLSTTASRTWNRQRTAKSAANALTLGVQYDYRKRDRNVDVLRPVGADDDESQVPIATFTGTVGLFFEWEHRNDRAGSLQPLAPEKGFRLEGRISGTHPALSLNIGQDTFAKASLSASKYWLIGSNLVFRLDGRYDHGLPLGGAALLPEVERFFGGGDSTVRGYEDDRLGTEIIQVGVPPLDNLTQIRVLPAGGNIRLLGSADAQIRVYKLIATALFFDAGIITNQWSTVTVDDIRPSVGMALIRIVTPFGAFAAERAIPLRARLGDNPRGRWHISFAARAQF
jgi:outer membrane protein assembly factor BamA